MKEVKQTIYETEDNKQFFTKNEAESHERELKNTKYFKVFCNPDLMEGRGFNNTLYFGIKSIFECHKLFMEEYCIRKFNSKIAWVMGVQPIENYIICEIQSEETKSKDVKMLDYRNINLENFDVYNNKLQRIKHEHI